MLHEPTPFLTAIHSYVAQCCARETPPRVSELADLLGLHRSRVSREFRRRHGATLKSYLLGLQLALAADMLRGSDLPTHSIAYRSGFGTRRSLFRAFRARARCTPSHIRAIPQ